MNLRLNNRNGSRLPALLVALFAAICPADRSASAADLVYVIPTHGMIERGLVYVVRRALAEAAEKNAKAIIFDMDTPGGRLDAAEEIINIVGNVQTPTYTYVNPNAISAGAIIALATDHIYMAPGSRIGDAMPLMMNPLGAPQETPRNIEEKAASYTASLIRSAAQRNGHDPKLAEAMVRPQGYTIDNTVICPTNQLLTLTNIEAERQVGEGDARRTLLSSGTVRDLDELLRTIGLENAEKQTFAISPAETVARYIEMFSALFLIGGLLGLYIEFKTPGFGFPGIAGMILLAIWFWGYHIAGLAGAGEALLFLLGVALLVAEIFLFPGFGVAGIAGLVLIVTALLMAMTQHYPGGPWYPPAYQVQKAVTLLSSSILVTLAAGLLIARYLPGLPAFSRIALATEIPRKAGYQASADTTSLVGRRGITATALRPAGIALIDNQRRDVVSQAEFIEPNTPIVVAATHGNRIIVQPLHPS